MPYHHNIYRDPDQTVMKAKDALDRLEKIGMVRVSGDVLVFISESKLSTDSLEFISRRLDAIFAMLEARNA